MEPPVVPLAKKLPLELTSLAATVIIPAIPETLLALTNPAKLATPLATVKFT